MFASSAGAVTDPGLHCLLAHARAFGCTLLATGHHHAFLSRHPPQKLWSMLTKRAAVTMPSVGRNLDEGQDQLTGSAASLRRC
jgi:hypothetical protein